MSRKHSPSANAQNRQQPTESYPQQTDGGEPLMPSPEPKPVSKHPSHEADRIGDILRRVREHRREDLETISDYLRIRLNYLVALENNRYEDLPADAYVIGFLRTYSLYLGLDGKGAIDHYRREMAGRRRKPPLTMPQPMPEGRAPTLTVLAGAGAAVLLIFFAWYGLSSPDVISPPRETSTTSAQEQGANTDPLTTQTATSDGIALTVPVSAITTNPVDIDIKGPEISPDPISTLVEPKQTPPDTQGLDANKNHVKEIRSVSQKTDVASKDKIDVEPIPPLQLLSEEPAKIEGPAVYGDKAKSRVLIKSDKESWIMITDNKGVTIFDKTLKPGESYNVPTAKGLKLTTSNPAGIVFHLDGSALPKMSTSSEIARAIPLEPEKLKNRITEADATSTD